MTLIRTSDKSKTAAKTNPCHDCHKDTPDGIDCDACKNWYCTVCINQLCPNTLTPELYDKLSKLQQFNWDCHHCSTTLLPCQLVQSKIAKKSELLNFGINPDALTFVIGASTFTVTAPSTTPADISSQTMEAFMQRLLQQQTVQQQNMLKSLLEAQQKAQEQSMQIFKEMFQSNVQGGHTTPKISSHQQGIAPNLVNTSTSMPGEPAAPQPSVPGGQIAPPYSFPGVLQAPQFNFAGENVPIFGIQGRQPASQQSASGVTGVSSANSANGQQLPFGSTVNMVPNFHLPLPKIELQKFTGDIDQYSSWWESFDSNIHSRADLPEKLKWDYLRQVVQGSAARKIDGLGDSASNYAEAIAILKSVYGREDLLKPNLWAALDHLEPVKANFKNLEEFTDAVRSKTSALKRLGVSVETLNEYTSILYHKLPCNLQSEIQKMTVMLREISPDAKAYGWSLEQFLRILMQFQLIHSTSIGQKAKPKETVDEKQTSASGSVPTATNLIQGGNQNQKKYTKGKIQTNARWKPFCIFCDGSHYSDSCKTVTSLLKRKDIVKEKNLCFKCLGTGHMSKNCLRRKKCFFCSGLSHHSSLCNQKFGETKSTKSFAKNKSPNQDPVASSNSTSPKGTPKQSTTTQLTTEQRVQGQDMTEAEAGPAIMATMPAVLVNPFTGKEVSVTTYLDGGSENTNVCEAIADMLNLIPTGTVTMSTARFGDSEVKDIVAKRVSFIFKGPSGYHMQMSAWAVPTICPSLVSKPIVMSAETEHMLESFQVVNKPPSTTEMMAVDLLIGMDYYNVIMHSPQSQIHCLDGSLRIHETPFGGVLSGCPSQQAQISKKKARLVSKQLLHTTGEDLRQIWSHDTVGITDSTNEERMPIIWSLGSIGIPDTEKIESLSSSLQTFFTETTKKMDDGRYEVRFPFKSSVEIPSNFNLALKRLQTVLKKLCPDGTNTEMLQKYNNIFEEQFQNGIIETVEWKQPPLGKILHYVSHFPVIKKSSSTTKVRIVIDPSAKTSSGVCLNDLLYVGTNFMEDLAGLLLRFRMHKWVMTADIEKAFLQVGLHPEDRDAVRFLWLKDPCKPDVKDNLQIMRYTRIPFGIVSSPFLLLATIHHHLSLNPGPLADRFKNQIYMDNVLLGADSEDECYEIYNESKALFNRACMNLREWNSNLPGFHESIPEKDKTKDRKMKVLGVIWDTLHDSFSLQPVEMDRSVATKRMILHNVAKLFDPLGLMNPVTIRGRTLLQELWKEKLSWDAQISESQQIEWKALQDDLIQLPRTLFKRQLIQDHATPINLFCFTDASPIAYATVIYIQQSLGKPEIIFSKAKVAPIKPLLTLPRLELLGILIGRRAMKFVEDQLKTPVKQRILWSDSQIAIQQVQSSKPQPIWIQRRANEILSYEPFEMLYIPGIENPADQATRGISMARMMESNWFNGPPWLAQSQENWPKWPLQPEKEGTNTNLVVSSKVPVLVQKQKAPTVQEKAPFDIDPKWFSSLFRMLRVTAYCQRFCNSMKGKKPTEQFLTTSEINQARKLWIKYVQFSYFRQDIQAMQKGKHTQLIKQLNLFLDKDEIIRCGGRMANAPIEYDAKFPVLLPKQSGFSDLVIIDCHGKNFHFKAKSTLSKVRMRYWIPNGLSVVRKLIKKCQICQKTEGGPFQTPQMGQLPEERLSRAPAFQNTALDYIGPLSIKTPGKSAPYEKRWIALFTCFTTRAIHLELIKDCSTESAINAIERFIARRGTPRLLMSDNQTCFLKAAKALKLLWSNQPVVEKEDPFAVFYAREGIIWRTIPEHSPWFNGLTERLVSLVKWALKKTLWRASIGEDQLMTLITQIEGVLNCRPLLSVDSELHDGAVLTPAHFIAPSTQLGSPPDDNPGDPEYRPNQSQEQILTASWKTTQKKLDNFWKIYSSQYLQELREVHKLKFKAGKSETCREPKIGEVCLLQEKGPRLHWPLVKVEQLLRSEDGFLRYVKIRLPSGIITRRGVRDLIPLEIELEKHPGQVKAMLLKLQVFTEEKQIQKKDKVMPNGLVQQREPVKNGHHCFRKWSSCPLLFSLILVLLTCFQSILAMGTSHLFHPPGNATFQICLHGPGGKLLILPEKRQCIYPPSCDQHKKINATVFVPNHHWPTSPAFLCYKEKIEVCTSTSFVGGRGIVKPRSVTKTNVPLEVCKVASIRFVHNGIKLIQNKVSPNLYSTNKVLNVRYKWWSTVCSAVENFIIERGEVASHDGIAVSSNLLSTENCHLTEGYCFLPDATLIWSIPRILNFCPYAKKGIYTAWIDGLFLSIPSLQASFLLTQKHGQSIHHCLPAKSVWTKEGLVIFFGIHTGHTNVDLQEAMKTESQPTQLVKLRQALSAGEQADAINPKLNFLFHTIMQAWMEQFRKDYYQFCLLAQREEETGRQLVQLDPTRGARAYLGRDDISAEFVGNKLYVHKCFSVTVETICLNHQHPETKKCHTFIPVRLFNSSVWFITPGSSDLVPEAPEIPCHAVEQCYPSHVASSGTTSVPTLLMPPNSGPNSLKFTSFSTPPLFKSRISYSPQILKAFSARVLGIERRLSATINYTSQISFDPSVVRETLAGVGEMAGHIITATGGAIGGVIKDSFSGVGNLIDHLSSPLFILGLTIVVALIVFGILGLAAYQLYFRFQQNLFCGKLKTDVPRQPVGLAYTLSGVTERNRRRRRSI